MTKMCDCLLCSPSSEPKEPTVLCPSISFWRFQLLTQCCCKQHVDCIYSAITKCECPRCCRCKNTNTCINCMKKHLYYFVCSHQEVIDEGRTEFCEIFLKELKKKTDLQEEIEVFKVKPLQK